MKQDFLFPLTGRQEKLMTEYILNAPDKKNGRQLLSADVRSSPISAEIGWVFLFLFLPMKNFPLYTHLSIKLLSLFFSDWLFCVGVELWWVMTKSVGSTLCSYGKQCWTQWWAHISALFSWSQLMLGKNCVATGHIWTLNYIYHLHDNQ